MAKKVLARTSSKTSIRTRRRFRIRNKIVGTAERPRLCVTKTNKSLFVQLINDDLGVTLLAASTPKGKAANRDLAKALGAEIAKAASAKGIANVVFDRSGNLYHGRVAAVADGARAGGLKF